MASNAVFDTFSSVDVLTVQFQDTGITSNHRLQWEEDPPMCCVTLEGHAPTRCLSVFDVRMGLSCLPLGVGAVSTPQRCMACVSPSTCSPAQFPGPQGRMCAHKVMPWAFHLPPGLLSLLPLWLFALGCSPWGCLVSW